MKMYLNDFKELTMAELLSVNGGYTGTTSGYSTSGGAGAYPSAGGTGSYSAYSATTPTGTPHSTVPEGYSPTSGWLPGWGPDGYTALDEEESADPSNPAVPTTEIPETAIWGQISDAEAETIRMQQGGKEKMGDGAELQLEGCKMAATAQIITQITDGAPISVSEVNKFADANDDGLLEQAEISTYLQDKVAANVDVATDYWETQLSLDNIEKSLAKPGTHYILARAENVHGGDHWIVLEGSYTNNQGQVEFNYNPSSENDAGRRFVLGSPLPGQENVYKISRVEIFTIN